MENEIINETLFAKNFRRELQTLNYVELNYLISDIMLEIKKRSYNEGMVKGMTSYGSAEEVAPVETSKSPQQIRDEIVDFAKNDISELSKQESQNLLRPRFVVNSEKRTIVCLLERFDLGYIQNRGIAKCDPSDCFNAHIGKAIALRRALGLEVPSEYYNAPQPTEVRVGDVVKSLVSGTTGTAVDSEEGKYTLNQNGVYYTLAHSVCDVIDDSRDGVTL